MTTETQTSLYQPVGEIAAYLPVEEEEIAAAIESVVVQYAGSDDELEQFRAAFYRSFQANFFDQLAEKLATMTRAENLGAQPNYDLLRAVAIRESVALPVISKPQGITRRGQRTVLKAERKQLASRLCGAFVEGRRLNRAERRFAARQLKFA